RGRDPRRVAFHDEAGLGRQRIQAAPDAAAVAVVRPPRDRRRRSRALHRAPRESPRERRRARPVTVKLTVPDIGNFSDVEVIDVLVAEGDTVEVEQGLITIETDKAAMDVPSTHAGKITKLYLKAGDKVSKG